MIHYIWIALILFAYGFGVSAGEYGPHAYLGMRGLDAGAPAAEGLSNIFSTTYYYGDAWIDSGGAYEYYKREMYWHDSEWTWTSSEIGCLGDIRYHVSIGGVFPAHVEDMELESNVASRDHVTLKAGDMRVTPFLISRTFDDWTLKGGVTVFIPTGDFTYHGERDPLKASRPNVGKGYWTGMVDIGAMVVLDEGKTWTLGAEIGYEMHSVQSESRIRYGDHLHVEAGVGKSFMSGWKAGVVGYASVQTEDNGVPNGVDSGFGDRIFAAGVEVGYGNESSAHPWLVSVRGLQEFGVRGAVQGFKSVLSIGLQF